MSLQERMQEEGRFRGVGSKFRGWLGSWDPVGDTVRPEHLEIEYLWVEEEGFVTGLFLWFLFLEANNQC